MPTPSRLLEAVEKALDECPARSTPTPPPISVLVVQDLSTFIKESQDGLPARGRPRRAVRDRGHLHVPVQRPLDARRRDPSIPLSVMTALVLMQLAGISLNVMTLGGLAVAVGQRRRRRDRRAREHLQTSSAWRRPTHSRAPGSTRSRPRAITASHADDGHGLPAHRVRRRHRQPSFSLPFALTVTFALLASLVVALTVVPVLAFLFIDKVKLNARRGRRAQEFLLDQDLHAGNHLRSAQPRDAAGACSVSRRSSSSRRWRSSASSPRLSSSMPARRRSCRRSSAAGRRDLRGGPRDGDRGRADPDRSDRPGRVRPDKHSGRE